MKLLLVAPLGDPPGCRPVTREATLPWAGEVMRDASLYQVACIAWLGAAATRPLLEATLAAVADEEGLFCFLGHGHPLRLLDGGGGALVDEENIGRLRGKFVYAVACNAGDELGRMAVAEKAGVAGFLGFAWSLWLPTEPELRATLRGHLLAGLWVLVRDRGSAAQAREAVLSGIARMRRDLLRPGSRKPFNRVLAAALLHNSEVLVLHGDAEWRWRG